MMRGGARARSKGSGSGPDGVGLRGFKSHPPHHKFYINIGYPIRLDFYFFQNNFTILALSDILFAETALIVEVDIAKLRVHDCETF